MNKVETIVVWEIDYNLTDEDATAIDEFYKSYGWEADYYG